MNTPVVTARSLPALLDTAVFLSLEHQLNLIAEIGDTPSWSYTYPDRLTLTGLRRRIRFDTQLLGTVTDQRWTWAWADPSLPAEVTASSQAVRTYGIEHQIAEFTDPTVAVDSDDAATLLASITKPITGHWVGFTFTPSPGWSVFAALTAPMLPLPEPSAVSTVQVLGAAGEQATNVRRAVIAYAAQRDLRVVTAGSSLSVGGWGWRVNITLDEAGAMSDLVVETY